MSFEVIKTFKCDACGELVDKVNTFKIVHQKRNIEQALTKSTKSTETLCLDYCESCFCKTLEKMGLEAYPYKVQNLEIKEIL